MDHAWGQAVEGEQAIELPKQMDKWIDMEECNLGEFPLEIGS